MTTKAPASKFVVKSTALVDDKPACGGADESENATSASSTLHLTATWTLSQLSKVYRLAKPMQKVTSTWTSAVELVQGSEKKQQQQQQQQKKDDDEEGEKQANEKEAQREETQTVKLKTTIRVVFIPIYETQQHQKKEENGEAAAAAAAAAAQETQPPSGPGSAVVIEMKFLKLRADQSDEHEGGQPVAAQELPFVSIATEEDSEAEAGDDNPKNFSSDSALGVADGGIDPSSGTCFITLPIPPSLLSKSRIQQQKDTPVDDSTVFPFSVAVAVPMPDRESFFSTATAASGDGDDDGTNRDASVGSSIVQGMLSTVGGFWGSVASTTGAAASAAAAGVQEAAASAAAARTGNKNEDEPSTSNGKEGGEDDTKQQESTPAAAAGAGAAETETGAGIQSPSPAPPPLPPLPAALSIALPTSEKALHRWLQWCASEEGKANGAGDHCLRAFDRVVHQLNYVFEDDLEAEEDESEAAEEERKGNNTSSGRIRNSNEEKHKSLFLASTFLLGSFSCATAMPPFSVAGALSSADLREFVLSNDEQHIIGTTSSSTSSSVSRLAQKMVAAEEVLVVNRPDDGKSATDAGGGASSEAARNKTNSRFFSLRDACPVLADFILAISNLAAVRIEYGAMYRPMLRAEGWARWIFSLDKLLQLQQQQPSETTPATSVVSKQLNLPHEEAVSSPQRNNQDATAVLSSMLYSRIDSCVLSRLSEAQRSVLESGARVAVVMEKRKLERQRLEKKQEERRRRQQPSPSSESAAADPQAEQEQEQNSQHAAEQEHHHQHQQRSDEVDDDESIFAVVLDPRALQMENTFRDAWGLSSIDSGDTAGVNASIFPLETNLRLSTHLLEQRCLVQPPALFLSSCASKQKDEDEDEEEEDAVRTRVKIDALLDSLCEVANSLSFVAPQLLVSAVSPSSPSNSKSSFSFDEAEAANINDAIESFETVRHIAKLAVLPLRKSLESCVGASSEAKWGARLLTLLENDKGSGGNGSAAAAGVVTAEKMLSRIEAILL